MLKTKLTLVNSWPFPSQRDSSIVVRPKPDRAEAFSISARPTEQLDCSYLAPKHPLLDLGAVTEV
jgi:hypothetical protein